MDGRDCEYCGYALCECGEAYKPVWRCAIKSPPDEGVFVLWFVPRDHWPILVGRRDSKSIDNGGDLCEPIIHGTCWMPLPDAPYYPANKKRAT